jgi:RNA polymerase sigma factor (sigma-70 family)
VRAAKWNVSVIIATMPAYDDSMLDGPARFATTRWSIVRRAAGGEEVPEGRAALEALCRTYWPAAVAYLRRRGHDREAARDLAQGFFASVLERDVLARADEARGSFRGFLATALRRFAANEHEAATAEKRGGRVAHVWLDADARGAEPISSDDTPELAFERAWVQALLDDVLQRLRAEYEESGQGHRFERLAPYLVPGEDTPPFADLADELGLAEASCRVAVFRARRRYRDLLRDTIAGTVDGRAGVDEELDLLLNALGRS